MCIYVIDAWSQNPLNPLDPSVSEYAERLYGWHLSLTLTISKYLCLTFPTNTHKNINLALKLHNYPS